MYRMTNRSLRRSWTYKRSISEYLAPHSLCVGTSCGPGAVGTADQLDRATNSGSVIVVGLKEYHGAAAWNFFCSLT